MTNEDAIKKHYEWNGKIEVISRVKVDSKEALSIAYTPGVAAPCLEIEKDESLSYKLTRRNNLVAVITDGSAVLGLGNIGPSAGMPVMEGKCVLFKEFADVDAFPICINSNDVDEIVNTIYLISKSFGAINLEDISAPRCFEIEKKLKEKCDIPIFHDDQHGTAVVTAAAVINACRILGKDLSSLKCVINGAGSAGNAIGRFLLKLGVSNIILCNSKGAISRDDDSLSPAYKALAEVTNPDKIRGSLKDAIKGADLFIGVSVANCVTADMVKSMADNPIVFAMANPNPEILPDEAKLGGAKIIGTGRSDYPNQINNVLAFPGIFKGALMANATDITENMKIAAANAIADFVKAEDLNENHILPLPFEEGVADAVAKAVADAAVKEGVIRK
jgi:malate dehydrogenase (oxaloacetate-decarboxylating)